MKLQQETTDSFSLKSSVNTVIKPKHQQLYVLYKVFLFVFSLTAENFTASLLYRFTASTTFAALTVRGPQLHTAVMATPQDGGMHKVVPGFV